MIRKCFLALLLGLTCLSLVACGTFQVGRQQEPVAGQVEAAENPAGLAPETETSAAGSAEMTAAESDANATATATLDTAAPEEVGETETAIMEMAADPGEGTVYAQRTAETVVLPACYDFDDGQSLVPPDPACDFSILPGADGGTIEIYPQGGAQLAYGGVFPEAPALAECAASDAFSAETETVAPLAAMYVCYQTGEGRTGYLHFTGADLTQAGTLTLDWLTFAGDGGGGAGDLAYRNERFGFSLVLPPTWSGFNATVNDHAEGSNICFTFTGSAPFCVLQIDVWQKTAWSNLESVPDGYYLGENEQFVFAAGPYREACVQLDDFQCERYRELPAILAGFRVE